MMLFLGSKRFTGGGGAEEEATEGAGGIGPGGA